MKAWASFAGLGLTGLGILVGLYWPTVATWAVEETDEEEFHCRIRFGVGVALVFMGTALQMYAAWPG
jgi:hypothetical protein